MDNLTVKMIFAKSTKNTHVYHSVDTAIPSLYIAKSGLPSDPPKTITVTVTEDDN